MKEYWRNMGSSGPHGYKTYVDRGEAFHNFLFKHLLSLDVNKDNFKILEVGCNCGGNLNFLHKKGFKNLSGFDISVKSIEFGKNKFKNINLDCSDAIDYLSNLKKDSYDLVFSVGCLINIKIHNKEECLQVIDHMKRVSREYVMIKEKNMTIPGMNCVYEKQQENNESFLRVYRK